MNAYSNGPMPKPHWHRPIAYSDSVADPPRRPRAVLLRSSGGYLLGVGIVGKRQRYIKWKGFR